MNTTNDTNSDTCENCSSAFSLFKRKKICTMCNQSFCQFCVTRQSRIDDPTSRTSSSSSERICSICKTICAPEATADDMLKLKLKHLRSVLNKASIPTNTCKEKRDLVDLMLRNKEKFQKYHRPITTQQNPQQNPTHAQSQSTFNNTVNSILNNVQDFVSFNLNSVLNPGPVPCPPPPNRSDPRPQANYNTSSSSNSSTSSNNLGSVFNSLFGEQMPHVINNTFSQFNYQDSQGSNLREPTPPPPPPPREPTPPPPQPQPTNIKRRASISDLKNESDVENLSIKQIKEILASNFVEYKGCCERKELVEKLLRLYRSHQENKRLEQELNATNASAASLKEETKQNLDESDICKICMESIIDCVLLECGHMCSCIKCGKQLAECPLCRQNVVRVVRVFKS